MEPMIIGTFIDVDGDGEYSVGLDYPAYNINNDLNCLNDDMLFGDQVFGGYLMIKVVTMPKLEVRK